MGTRGAPRATLRREAGAKKNLIRQEFCFLSCSARRFSSGPEQRGQAVPPELPCVRRQVLDPRGHMPALELS
jgi:hypothetical protein